MAEGKYWKPTKLVTGLLILSIAYCAITWTYGWFFSGVVSSSSSSFSGLVTDMLGGVAGSTGIFASILGSAKNYQRAYNLGIAFLMILLWNIGTLPLSSLFAFPIVAIIAILSVVGHAWSVYTSITYRGNKNILKETKTSPALTSLIFSLGGLLHSGSKYTTPLRLWGVSRAYNRAQK